MVVLDNPTSNPTAYSNFLILSRAETGRGLMLDRSRPTDSLLIQYGLPREDAKFPHPDADGWRPSFVGQWDRDPTYRSLVKWIGEELYRPTPNYGITWRPPTRPTGDDVDDAADVGTK
jgi:hypothetical protein